MAKKTTVSERLSMQDRLKVVAESFKFEKDAEELAKTSCTFGQFLRRFGAMYWNAIYESESAKYEALANWRRAIDRGAKILSGVYVSEVEKAILGMEENDEMPSSLKKIREQGRIGFLNQYVDGLKEIAK